VGFGSKAEGIKSYQTLCRYLGTQVCMRERAAASFTAVVTLHLQITSQKHNCLKLHSVFSRAAWAGLSPKHGFILRAMHNDKSMKTSFKA